MLRKTNNTLNLFVQNQKANKIIPVAWVPNFREKNFLQHKTEGNIIVSGKNKELTNYVLEMINNAQKTITICSFLLAHTEIENALFAAVQRGVRIYLMLACENILDNMQTDDTFEQKCLEQHKKMLKKLAGHVFIRSAPHYHAKVILVDAENEYRQGLLLTANFTTEAFERNEELAIILNDDDIIELRVILRWALFENAKHSMLNSSQFTLIKPLNKIEYPLFIENLVITSTEEQAIKDQVLKLINNARTELIISSYGWEKEHEVIKAICEQAQNGVKVTILSRIRSECEPALKKLKKAGATVYGFKYLHAKAIWNDSNNAMIMSANLQTHGLDTGFELGIKLEDDKAHDVKASLLNFLNTPYKVLNLKVSPSPLILRQYWKIKNRFQGMQLEVNKGKLKIAKIPPPKVEDKNNDNKNNTKQNNNQQHTGNNTSVNAVNTSNESNKQKKKKKKKK